MSVVCVTPFTVDLLLLLVYKTPEFWISVLNIFININWDCIKLFLFLYSSFRCLSLAPPLLVQFVVDLCVIAILLHFNSRTHTHSDVYCSACLHTLIGYKSSAVMFRVFPRFLPQAPDVLPVKAPDVLIMMKGFLGTLFIM